MAFCNGYERQNVKDAIGRRRLVFRYWSTGFERHHFSGFFLFIPPLTPNTMAVCIPWPWILRGLHDSIID
jgi:hypothetical protein